MTKVKEGMVLQSPFVRTALFSTNELHEGEKDKDITRLESERRCAVE